jgi:hypothetical protein
MQENTQPVLQNESPNMQVNQSMPVRENAFRYPEQQKAAVQFNLTPPKINPLILILLIIIFLLGLGIILWKFVFGSNVDFLNAFRAAPSPTPTIVAITPTATPTVSPTATSSAAVANWQTYNSSTAGFEIRHPNDWLIKNDILTSYDPGDYQGQKPIPEKIVKCDFLPGSDLSTVNIISQSIIQQDNPKITKMETEYKNPDMSMGDNSNIEYIFEQNTKAERLICFFFDPSLEEKLNQIILTFKFL